MAVADSLEAWTDSARQIIDMFKNVNPEGYMPITTAGIANLLKLPIWQYDDIHDAYTDPPGVLSDLRGYLAASADDVPVRWTVLAFLYDLCEGLADGDEDDEEADESDRDPWSDEERAPFREELAALVSLPDIAGIDDPALARWEIHNSCLIADFARAEALFRRVQEIEPETAVMNCARQGEFHLLRAKSADLALEGEQAAFNDEVNAALHLAIARSYELSGEPGRARDALARCVEVFPKYGAAYRRLAELAITLHADYRGAYEVLVQWSEAEPDLASDIWVRTLRGLGGIQGGHSIGRMLDEFFDAHPDRLRWVTSAVRIHWTAFESLSEKAQKQWLYGSWILWWRPPGFEAIDYAAAATYFARTLEIELRDRVFVPFVGTTDVKVLKADWTANRLNTRGKAAWKRICDGSGALGDMLTECDPHRNSDLVASKMFRKWLGESVPVLASRYDKNEVGRLNSIRTRSTHTGEEARDRAEEVCALCRRYLEYILVRT